MTENQNPLTAMVNARRAAARAPSSIQAFGAPDMNSILQQQQLNRGAIGARIDGAAPTMVQQDPNYYPDRQQARDFASLDAMHQRNALSQRAELDRQNAVRMEQFRQREAARRNQDAILAADKRAEAAIAAQKTADQNALDRLNQKFDQEQELIDMRIKRERAAALALMDEQERKAALARVARTEEANKIHNQLRISATKATKAYIDWNNPASPRSREKFIESNLKNRLDILVLQRVDDADIQAQWKLNQGANYQPAVKFTRNHPEYMDVAMSLLSQDDLLTVQKQALTEARGLASQRNTEINGNMQAQSALQEKFGFSLLDTLNETSADALTAGQGGGPGGAGGMPTLPAVSQVFPGPGPNQGQTPGEDGFVRTTAKDGTVISKNGEPVGYVDEAGKDIILSSDGQGLDVINPLVTEESFLAEGVQKFRNIKKYYDDNPEELSEDIVTALATTAAAHQVFKAPRWGSLTEKQKRKAGKKFESELDKLSSVSSKDAYGNRRVLSSPAAKLKKEAMLKKVELGEAKSPINKKMRELGRKHGVVFSDEELKKVKSGKDFGDLLDKRKGDWLTALRRKVGLTKDKNLKKILDMRLDTSTKRGKAVRGLAGFAAILTAKDFYDAVNAYSASQEKYGELQEHLLEGQALEALAEEQELNEMLDEGGELPDDPFGDNNTNALSPVDSNTTPEDNSTGFVNSLGQPVAEPDPSDPSFAAPPDPLGPDALTANQTSIGRDLGPKIMQQMTGVLPPDAGVTDLRLIPGRYQGGGQRGLNDTREFSFMSGGMYYRGNIDDNGQVVFLQRSKIIDGEIDSRGRETLIQR